MQRLLVKSLQLLVVLLLRVHLYLQRVHLQELGALLHIVNTVLRLAGLVQLLQDFRQTGIVTTVEAELAELRGRGGEGRGGEGRGGEGGGEGRGV